jgi:hypothetical protein
MPVKNFEIILELDNQLTRLRTHYDYFEGSDAKEVLEWARFFQRWTKFASNQGLSWVKPHLQQANFLVSEFSGRKPTAQAYEILQRVMREAAEDLRSEVERSREKAL